jgi:predicted DNA-binding protein with PD1-like motif
LKDTYLGLVHGHAAVATKDGRVRSGMLLEALRGRLWRHQLLVVEAEGALV